MKKLHISSGFIIVAFLWIALAVYCWVRPAGDISQSERRVLAQFPELTADSVLSGSFFDKFEDYSLDQFPLRDGFRMLKALSSKYVLFQLDNNDIYILDGYAAKHEYVLNENSVISAGEKLTGIYEKYIAGVGGEVYLTVIPDKGHYLAGKGGYMTLDFEKIVDIITEQMPFAQYIDIKDTLDYTDYYHTDSHWSQDKIIMTAEKLANAMGTGIRGEYTENDAGVDFLGVYSGQAALPMKSERIIYLTNDILDGCTVYNPETGKTTGLYDLEKAGGRDPYDVFLSGAAPILYIDNPKGDAEKKLIVFRDSFGSSMVPLLSEGYSQITVVDTRYISSDYLGDYVDFEGADVLFMYSSTILNESGSLR